MISSKSSTQVRLRQNTFIMTFSWFLFAKTVFSILSFDQTSNSRSIIKLLFCFGKMNLSHHKSLLSRFTFAPSIRINWPIKNMVIFKIIKSQLLLFQPKELKNNKRWNNFYDFIVFSFFQKTAFSCSFKE